MDVKRFPLQLITASPVLLRRHTSTLVLRTDYSNLVGPWRA